MEKKKIILTYLLIIAIILFIASLVGGIYIILSKSTEKNIAYIASLIFTLSGFLIAYAGDFLIRNKKR